MDVLVTHPAYVRHTARGARIPRDTLARIETPVAVRTVDAGLLEPVAKVRLRAQHYGLTTPRQREGKDFPVLSHDGGLWVPLTYVDGYAGPNEMQVERFVEYLRGEFLGGSRQDGMTDAFAGTPLQDLPRSGGLHGGHEDGRGMPYDPERQREVFHDGRAEASRRVAEFLASEILFSDDGVFRRFRPVAMRLNQSRDWMVPDLARRSPLWSHPGVALDRLDDALLVEPGHPVTDAARQEAARILAFAPHLAGDARDVDVGLAHVAGDAAKWLVSAARDRQGDPAELRAVADGFAPFHMRLRIGGLPEADRAEALRWTRRAVAFVRQASAPAGAFADRVGRAERYLDGIVAPRLQARMPVAPDDLASLGGLAR